MRLGILRPDMFRSPGRSFSRAVLVLGAALGAGQLLAGGAVAMEEVGEPMRARGTFEVRLSPLETYNKDEAAKVGRMSIDKTFEGDLVASSQGEMLTGGSPADGSAGYVAIERVTGALGRAKRQLLASALRDDDPGVRRS